MTKQTAKATAGERIARKVWFSDRTQWTEEEHRRFLARDIDSAIRRAVKAERERCVRALRLRKANVNTSRASAADLHDLECEIMGVEPSGGAK